MATMTITWTTIMMMKMMIVTTDSRLISCHQFNKSSSSMATAIYATNENNIRYIPKYLQQVYFKFKLH